MYGVIKEKLDIDCPKIAWSKIEDYDEYLDYQNMIREAVSHENLSDWEFAPTPLM